MKKLFFVCKTSSFVFCFTFISIYLKLHFQFAISTENSDDLLELRKRPFKHNKIETIGDFVRLEFL